MNEKREQDEMQPAEPDNGRSADDVAVDSASSGSLDSTPESAAVPGEASEERVGGAHAEAGSGEGTEPAADDSSSSEPSIEEMLADASPESMKFDESELLDDDEIVDDFDDDEDAAPIEDLVEDAPQDESIEMNWYIIKVQVNREKSICDALWRRVTVAGLERYFDEVLVPTEDVREFTKSGKQRIVKRKLYPGYIVVRMSINDDSWFLVRETPGIGDFTGAAGKPAPLSEEEIGRIVASTKPETVESTEETVKTAIRFKVGDRVRVREGYFQNYEGEVSNIDERNGRITVMINIFGRPNPVELDHWQVEDL